MSPAVRVAAFCTLLVAIFGVAALAGSRLAPVSDAGEPEPEPAHHGAATAPHDEDEDAAALRLVPGDTTLTAGRPSRLTFRIASPGGATLRDFEVEQGRRMHLIVVRRDLRRFQHLHPVRDARGTWSARLTLPDAGVYHAFADFRSAGARHTPGVDLFVPGSFAPLPLPAPSHVAAADGYDVTLRDDGDELRFTVGRGGAMKSDLQPYLGARGHLVMLRAGDLAYEHAHPIGDELAFDVGDAAPGRYRLFVQFRHGGHVRTAAFTHEVTP